MESNTLKELMISEIKHYSYLDYIYERGDHNAKSFSNYEDYLRSLDDSDFLITYNQVNESINTLD
jgi:hypothetical protein